ncbi:MAG: type II toxin-antitoxin system VapB family antitoxin [Verrucomicrobia bacterium]|jgi:Arc/MetJ family transcription regulator|nr:type II toxin-antitoxin system VapB family antitoxin [Verrucomicrobiota bacterium]
MATNLKIDEQLLSDALEIGNFKTKKEAVNKALADFVQRQKQLKILEWEGKVEFFNDYDYKKFRSPR